MKKEWIPYQGIISPIPSKNGVYRIRAGMRSSILGHRSARVFAPARLPSPIARFSHHCGKKSIQGARSVNQKTVKKLLVEKGISLDL
jgi:hypothetical protein